MHCGVDDVTIIDVDIMAAVITDAADDRVKMYLGNHCRHLFGLGKVASNWKNLVRNEHFKHTNQRADKNEEKMVAGISCLASGLLSSSSL
jgi:hypothetical protein